MDMGVVSVLSPTHRLPIENHQKHYQHQEGAHPMHAAVCKYSEIAKNL